MNLQVLPPMEHTFSIKVTGSETGQIFEGSFTYKRPNLRTRTNIDKQKAILDGGIPNLDEETKLFHEILSKLKYTIINAPEWWVKSDGGLDLYDLNVVLEINAKTNQFEKDWREKVYLGENKNESAGESK